VTKHFRRTFLEFDALLHKLQRGVPFSLQEGLEPTPPVDALAQHGVHGVVEVLPDVRHGFVLGRLFVLLVEPLPRMGRYQHGSTWGDRSWRLHHGQRGLGLLQLLLEILGSHLLGLHGQAGLHTVVVVDVGDRREDLLDLRDLLKVVEESRSLGVDPETGSHERQFIQVDDFVSGRVSR
jgi:hypothetical protein